MASVASELNLLQPPAPVEPARPRAPKGRPRGFEALLATGETAAPRPQRPPRAADPKRDAPAVASSRDPAAASRNASPGEPPLAARDNADRPPEAAETATGPAAAGAGPIAPLGEQPQPAVESLAPPPEPTAPPSPETAAGDTETPHAAGPCEACATPKPSSPAPAVALFQPGGPAGEPPPAGETPDPVPSPGFRLPAAATPPGVAQPAAPAPPPNADGPPIAAATDDATPFQAKPVDAPPVDAKHAGLEPDKPAKAAIEPTKFAPPQAAATPDPESKSETAKAETPAARPEALSRPPALDPANAASQAPAPSSTPEPAPGTILAAAHAAVAARLEPLLGGRPAAPLDAATPINGLAVEIAARARDGQHRFEIRLDPPELGRIDVRLDVDKSGVVTSRLVVERAETLDLLRRDAPSLERALQSAGLKTDGGLEFSLRDQSFGRHADPQRSERAEAVQAIVHDDDLQPVESDRRGYGRLVGLGAGVDIKV